MTHTRILLNSEYPYADCAESVENDLQADCVHDDPYAYCSGSIQNELYAVCMSRLMITRMRIVQDRFRMTHLHIVLGQ